MPKCYQGVSHSAAQRAILWLFIDQIRLPVRFYFAFRLGFFFEIGKKEDILDWEWGLISDPGNREKRPLLCAQKSVVFPQNTECIAKYWILPMESHLFKLKIEAV